jgi:hypothetical protein
VGPSRWDLATNRELARPTRREPVPQALTGLATSPAEQAKRLRAPAMTAARPPGPREPDPGQVPLVRPLDQPITRPAGGPGAVTPAAVDLPTRSGGARVLASCRKDFFGGVKDGLG